MSAPSCIYGYALSRPTVNLLSHLMLTITFTMSSTSSSSAVHTDSIYTTQQTPKMNTSNFLQLQTAAAHPRPATQPLQRNSCSDSPRSSSEDMSIPTTSTYPAATLPRDYVRCNRCHRSVSLTSMSSLDTMVSIGVNSYYCNRCAKIVGYKT